MELRGELYYISYENAMGFIKKIKNMLGFHEKNVAGEVFSLKLLINFQRRVILK